MAYYPFKHIFKSQAITCLVKISHKMNYRSEYLYSVVFHRQRMSSWMLYKSLKNISLKLATAYVSETSAQTLTIL